MDKPINNTVLKPCPWCGRIPQDEPASFVDTQGTKWGALICGNCSATGPEVRTGYRPLDQWKEKAIEEWNNRYDG